MGSDLSSKAYDLGSQLTEGQWKPSRASYLTSLLPGSRKLFFLHTVAEVMLLQPKSDCTVTDPSCDFPSQVITKPKGPQRSGPCYIRLLPSPLYPFSFCSGHIGLLPGPWTQQAHSLQVLPHAVNWMTEHIVCLLICLSSISPKNWVPWGQDLCLLGCSTSSAWHTVGAQINICGRNEVRIHRGICSTSRLVKQLEDKLWSFSWPRTFLVSQTQAGYLELISNEIRLDNGYWISWTSSQDGIFRILKKTQVPCYSGM